MDSIHKSSVAIVGSGLTGYMAAAALADAGCKNITVFDTLPDPTIFQKGRPYSQVIYQTSQRLLQKLPAIDKEFKAEAYCQQVRVVSDISPSGKAELTSTKPPKGPLYWILKSHMLELLDTQVRKQYPAVNFRFGTKVNDIIVPDKASTRATLLVKDTDGKEDKLDFDVLLACDGSNSTVRKIMSVHESQVQSKNGLGLYSKDSPATGVCITGLTLDESPVISKPGEPIMLAMPSVIYRLHGEKKGRAKDEVFSMMILPVSSGRNVNRRAAISVSEGHKLLTIKNVDEMFALFRANFPQLDIDALISVEEMESFVKTPANRFPPVQRPMSLAAYFGTGGMAFVGDSAHSFPTDSAQGINSAFQDV